MLVRSSDEKGNKLTVLVDAVSSYELVNNGEVLIIALKGSPNVHTIKDKARAQAMHQELEDAFATGE